MSIRELVFPEKNLGRALRNVKEMFGEDWEAEGRWYPPGGIGGRWEEEDSAMVESLERRSERSERRLSKLPLD